MSYAYVDPNGAIESVVVKPSPMRTMLPGWRLLPYNLPAVDHELHTVTPVQPVPAEATEVTFEVVAVPDAQAKQLARVIALIDTEVDQVYAKVIGNRGPEYTMAEEQAKTWALGGHVGTTPDYVRVWAEATGMTDTEAAADILQQAAVWRSAALAIREHRLKAKELIRAGNLNGGLQYWRTFMEGLRTQLGL